MTRTQRTNPGLIAAAAFLAVAIFLVDLSLPLGVAGGVPYVALVLTGWWFHRRSDIFVLAAVSSVLTAAGYLFSPEGGIPSMVPTNRALAFFAIWVTAVLLFTAKRAEEEIRDLAKFPEQNPEPVVRFAKDGILLYANPASALLMKELKCGIGEPAPEDWRRMFAEVLETNSPKEFEYEYGGLTMSFVINPVPEIGYVNVHGRDITARKRAEEALRESEEQLRAVIDRSPGAIVIKDLEGRNLIANKRFCSWYGSSGEKIIGKSAYDFLMKEVADQFTAQEHKVIETGTVIEEERQVTYPDGVTRAVFTQKFPIFGPGGDCLAVGTVINDITKRKRAEEALRLRNQELLTLHRISEISLQPHTLTEALQSIVDVISKATNFPDVSIELYDRKYNGTAHSRIKGVPVHSGGDSRRVPMEDTFCWRTPLEDTFCCSIVCSIVRSGGRMRKVPATNGSGRARTLKRHKMETIIPVPMIMGNTVVGVLTLAHPEKIKLEGRLTEWAATLANYLAALIDRMRAEEVLHQRVDLYRELSKRIETAGATSLHDHELMELLLLLTAPRNDAAALTERLMSGLGGFAEAINAEPRAIKEIHGGDEAIVAFAAVREATIRLAREELTKRPVFDSWDKLITYCRIGMAHEKTEHFRVLYLNRNNILIADEVGQKGTVDQTPFYPREVVKRALELSATALILVHNHPSGDATPSGDDIEITRDVREAVESLGIVLHDHLIISKSSHYSFRNMGLM